ncbi:hypothetical protein BV25DRAFT_1704758 [Artomyces pyxidatus]|uniref:Uncharacterized protein n=1 Tax=Artomyces pyxidatus TaxID=48021 RepID=A0ACB8TBI4_9AGAM|nr:hypothetical protein BV25DRAFT_1704758 [Artomyces pyxidatus]
MSDALFQNSYYIGNNFNCILYGVELVLYTMTMQRLLKHKSRRTRPDIFFMFFSTINLLLITIYVAVESVFGEEMWIVNASFPGGDSAYLQQYAAVWYQTMGTTASVALNLLSDGLMIYRCFVVWSDIRVVIIPCILYLATLALGIVELYTSGAPAGNFFSGLAAQLGVSYYATSIGLNIIATSIITGRIIYVGRVSRRSLGAENSQAYFSVAAIIVESALPYSLSGFAFLVSYGLNSEISILFLSFYVMFTCVSPQMLVLRVVEGRAWKRNQASDTVTTTFAFTSYLPTEGSFAAEDSGIHVHLESAQKRDVSLEDVEKRTQQGSSHRGL